MIKNKHILVLGATGRLGEPVARALKAAGYQVRILSRDAQKAHQLFGPDFEVTGGDPTDQTCLMEVMDGIGGVHISLPEEAELAAAQGVAQAAPRRGVERITYISGASVCAEHRWYPMVDGKYRAEQVLRKSGVPYTFLCPTWVMEILPMFINQGQASILGKQPTPYHWVAAQDIARMVCAAYQLDAASNRRYIVMGPQAIPMKEALRRYCATFHPEIKNVSSMPFWMARLMAGLMRNAELKGATEMMAYFENVGEQGDPTPVELILPAPTTTLDQWLASKQN